MKVDGERGRGERGKKGWLSEMNKWMDGWMGGWMELAKQSVTTKKQQARESNKISKRARNE